MARMWGCAGIWLVVYASVGISYTNGEHFFDGGSAPAVYGVLGCVALLLGVGTVARLKDSDKVAVFMASDWVEH